LSEIAFKDKFSDVITALCHDGRQKLHIIEIQKSHCEC